MKKIFYLAIAMAILSISCSKDNEKTVPAKEIVISQTADLQLQTGEKSSKITVSGGDETNFEVKSSNVSVAVVSSENKTFTVEAKGEGSAVITISSGGKTKMLNVKVVAPTIELSVASLEMKIGEKQEVNVSGENLKDFQVSTDSQFVSVTKNDNTKFTIEAKSEGEAIIVVQSAGVRKELTVRVLPKEIKIQSITFDKNQERLLAGRSHQLTPIISPENATNQKLTWKSSDPDVIRVDGNGNLFVSQRHAGKTATITATAQDGSQVEGQITIRATQLTNSLKIIFGQEAVFAVGTEHQLQVEVEPHNASDKFTWSSNDTSIISVDEQTGKITCLKEGTTSVIVTATDGSTQTASIQIKVITKADEIRFEEQSVTMKKSGRKPLTFSLFYDNVFKGKIDKNDERKKFLTFGSADRTAVEIKDMELVTYRKNGTYTITAVYNDGRQSPLEATIQVKVED